MTPTASSRFWELIGEVFSFNSEAFETIINLHEGMLLALLVVVLAGLSLSVGQSIILFINRVKPARFVFSLLLNAILFTFGFVFLVFSTWLICLLPWSVNVPFWHLMEVLGLSYAPLLFSFLGALPYLGVPILNLLSVWRLLAMIVGFSVVAGVSETIALGYVAFGWVVLQLLESTIGQPIAKLGKKVADKVAGVKLATNNQELREIVTSGIGQTSSPIITASQTRVPEVRQLFQASGRSATDAAQAVAQTVANQPRTSTELKVTHSINTSDPIVQLEQDSRSISGIIKWIVSLLAMVIIFIIVAALLRPIRDGLFGWYDQLPRFLRLIFNLFWIGVVAIVFAGLLAPLETLGWWAGWYGDDLNTVAAEQGSRGAAKQGSTGAEEQENSLTQHSKLSRYIVYLDGIGQSGEEYTPDVEDFLTAFKAVLPQDMELIEGLMMYSVLNKPLNEDRPLAFLWRLADKMRWSNPTALLGIMLNLRNVFIVAVSADQRYGPIYNQGIAQVLYNGLIAQGYQPGSGVPITLIGYSGGGQMSVAAGSYLKRATGAPIDVISLGGVMSANNNLLKLQHLYHLVGEKDSVERIGPIMFPGRWKVFFLSYWNRAKRKGKISIISLGEVGHQVPGGMMDPNAFLPDGRSYLQQTIEVILQILEGKALRSDQQMKRKTSNYALYKAAEFTRPDYYPVNQTVDPTLYRPIADWMGRLILPKPEQRQRVRGVLLEIYHAPDNYQHLVGQVVNLRWSNEPFVHKLLAAATRDVHFSADAEYRSKYEGLIHPDRLNHWQLVDPLESLAGSHPTDDVIVMLNEPVRVGEQESRGAQEQKNSVRAGFVVNSSAENTDLSAKPAPTTQNSTTSLYISTTPIQITGRYYALVKFIKPIAGTDKFRVWHFNKATRKFDGVEEIVRMPEVKANANGCFPSTSRSIERVSLNEQGWYIYGAKDKSGTFVVESLAPRALLELHPQKIIFGRKLGENYIRKGAWADAAKKKGRITSVLLSPRREGMEEAIAQWQENDLALVIHTYGGIGGKKKEPAASTPIFFGHFAYGVAQVIWEPLADELRFDIRYHQVYTHNTDGIIAGTLHWSRYMGDRQFGWAGLRPVCDMLIKLDSFTGFYNLDGTQVSPLIQMLRQLQVMTARYRIGDGTGGTFVGPANNCAQDSNRALFASLTQTTKFLQANPEIVNKLLEPNPKQEQRFWQLKHLKKELQQELQPCGGPRPDWENNEYNLGSTLEDNPIQNLLMGLASWRTLLPRIASDAIAQIFLKYGATIWVLRTNQIGGYDPDIEPIAPTSFSLF
ncbi:CAAX protease [Phormidium sp. LEGE 05292]|uniref:CAAX protease n=1 Tax=[Phormidium] sp. LEGE 05292 TaxID=767427 RepID=UPI00188119AB|nr:CAAX protease [Phormidium sp. LEGE 05292]MBE9225357.1 CAAX protease [Phormidium sp. LEGE 05292]